MNLVMKQVDTLKCLTALAKDIEKRIRQLEREFFESPKNLNPIIEIIGQQLIPILVYVASINDESDEYPKNLIGVRNINENYVLIDKDYIVRLLDNKRYSNHILNRLNETMIEDLFDFTIEIENGHKIQLIQTIMVSGSDFEYEEHIIAIEDCLYLNEIFERIIREHIGSIWQVYDDDSQMTLPHFMDPI